MKRTTLLALPAAAAFLFAACDQQTTESGGSDVKEVAVTESNPDPAPPAGGGNATAELAKQAIGKKLLGNTVKLSGEAFVAADLGTAPEYYLAYYSASW